MMNKQAMIDLFRSFEFPYEFISEFIRKGWGAYPIIWYKDDMILIVLQVDVDMPHEVIGPVTTRFFNLNNEAFKNTLPLCYTAESLGYDSPSHLYDRLCEVKTFLNITGY